MGFFNEVYRITKKIPEGRVATYGIIAEIAGNKRMARQVGWALHQNPDQNNIPCHRVVNKNGFLSGSFAFGGESAQKKLLEKEGVAVSDDNRVDLSKYLWEANGVFEN